MTNYSTILSRFKKKKKFYHTGTTKRGINYSKNCYRHSISGIRMVADEINSQQKQAKSKSL